MAKGGNKKQETKAPQPDKKAAAAPAPAADNKKGGKKAFPPVMSSFLDEHADPCTDFYQYACGGWMKKYPLQPFENRLVYGLQVLSNKRENVLEHIRKKHRVIDDFLHACNNVDAMNLGNKPLEKDLNGIVQAHTKEQVLERGGVFVRSGTNLFLSIQVQTDQTDASMNTAYFSPAQLTLRKPFYHPDIFPTVVNGYNQYINDVIKMAGYQGSPVEQTAATIVRMIEKKLEAIPDNGKTYRMSIKGAKKRWPFVFGHFVQGIGFYNVPKDDIKIYLVGKDYWDALERLIQSLSIDDLKLFIAYTMVNSRVPWLGSEFYQLKRKHLNLPQAPNRQVMCNQSVYKYLPHVFGDYFYQQAFDPTHKHYIVDLLHRMKIILEQEISHSQWLVKDEDVSQARSKLNHLLGLVGQSTVRFSMQTIVSRHYYPMNIQKLEDQRFEREIEKVGQHVNREEWQTNAAQLNAFYSPTENKMMLPAGILQPPFFYGIDAHPAHNFGGIGTVIAHELTHGFDKIGSQYDRIGTKRSWWSEATAQNFKDQAQCFQDLYSTFEIKGNGITRKVNGDQTLNENIADSGGLVIAWKAYREYMMTVRSDTEKEKSKEEDQMFFLAFSQPMCENFSNQWLEHTIAVDDHPPNSARVNGAVMNHPDFGKVFNCKPDTPMNPIKKCRIW